MTYRTYELALRRVEALKNQGIWPGIVAVAGGGWALTFDPDGEDR